MEIEFKVDGKAHNLHGDGFAIWLSRERGLSGPVFGSVGEVHIPNSIPCHTNLNLSNSSGADEFTGLGIFFDT